MTYPRRCPLCEGSYRGPINGIILKISAAELGAYSI